MKKIMIVAGEASGDLYGSYLVRALRDRMPGLMIFGMAGERMKASGVETISDIREVSVVGISEVISQLRKIQKAFKLLTRRLREERPDALILIDFPDFNLRLAKVAKKEKIPIIYYISPQVWAWRSGRVKKISRLVDKMLVAFPFETDIYRQRGMDAVFVGHPILDESIEFPKEDGLKRYNLDPERPVLAILPGSRRKEVERLLPLMLDTLGALEGTGIQAVLPVAQTVDFLRVEEMVKGRDIILTKGNVYEILGLSDVALITSGTATLQAAIKGTPMVIIYKVSPLTYLLGRLFVRVKDIGIVNILAGNEIVPELIQWDARAEKISRLIKKILEDSSYRSSMRKRLLEVRERLGGPGASERAAEEIVRFMDG